MAVACRPNALPCAQQFRSPGGTDDYDVSIERDAAGHDVHERMFDHSGKLFEEVTNRYDRAGRLVEADTVHFGKLDFVERYAYRGDDPRPSVARFDTDGDGDIDEVHHFRYRRDGTTTFTDDVERGTTTEEGPASRVEYALGGPRERPIPVVLDIHGHEILQIQWARDGTPDFWSSANTYDACGNLVQTDEDWHSDGTIDETTINRYDCR